MSYAGFWSRLFSLLIDFLVCLPIFIVWRRFVVDHSIAIALLTYPLVFALAHGFVYSIYFHARWGQTLGKMAAKIKVTQIDGTRIALKHAFLRSSVDAGLWLVNICGIVYVLVTWTEPEWSSLSFSERNQLLEERSPVGYWYDVISQVWLWSEMVVLLTNKKRRALHDFIAGTVVIHTRLKSVSPKVPAPGVLGLSRRATIFWAVALVVLVIILWPLLFPPPPPLE